MVPPETPPEPRRCKARSSQSGQPCRKFPMRGQEVCATHGGRAPRARAAAERRLAEEQITAALATYGRPIDTSPTEALLEEVKWTAGHVAWLRERVAELEPEALTWGKTEEVDKGSGEFTGTDITHAAKAPVLVQLYQQERAHLIAVCKTAITTGIEERRVKLAEQQGALLAGVVRAILADLDLTPAQSKAAPGIVAQHFRSVDYSLN